LSVTHAFMELDSKKEREYQRAFTKAISG
jgi:hypothetical protein